MENLQASLAKEKNFIFFMFTKGAGAALTMIMPLLLAKFMAPDLMGSFFLFKMAVFFSMSFLIAPLASPFNIESNKEFAEKGKSNETFSSFLIFLASAILIFFLLFFFWGEEVINFAGLDYEEYKHVFWLAFLGVTSSRVIRIFFLGQNNTKMNAIIEFIYPLSMIVFLITIFFLDIFTLANVLISYFIGGIVISVFSIFFVDYSRIWPLKFSSENFKELGKFSSWVILGTTTSYLINWGDNLVLKYYVSLSDIGVYNLAYQLFKGGLTIGMFINHYYTPFLSQKINKKKEIENFIDNTSKKALKYTLAIFLIAQLLIAPFIKLAFSESYHSSIDILRILLIANIPMIILAFYLPIFSIVKKYKFVNLMLIGQLSLNIILDIVLVPYLGIMGAAIATSTSYLAYFVIIKVSFETKIKNMLKTMWQKSSNPN